MATLQPNGLVEMRSRCISWKSTLDENQARRGMPMSDSEMTVAAYRAGLGRLVKDHLTQYRDSAGREGHIIDTTPFKNPRFTPTLLLQTRGAEDRQGP